MKKLIGLIAVVALFVISCGGGSQDAEIGAFLNKLSDLNERYAVAIEKADSAKAYGKAIDDYSTGLVDLMAKGVELQKKYPKVDLNASYFKKHEEKMEKIAERIRKNTAAKMMKYMDQPEVGTAMQNMQKKLESAEMPFQKK